MPMVARPRTAQVAAILRTAEEVIFVSTRWVVRCLTLGASNRTSIQETRFAGFVRNCANFAESAAPAKPGKWRRFFLGPATPAIVSGDRLGPKLAFVDGRDAARQPVQRTGSRREVDQHPAVCFTDRYWHVRFAQSFGRTLPRPQGPIDIL